MKVAAIVLVMALFCIIARSASHRTKTKSGESHFVVDSPKVNRIFGYRFCIEGDFDGDGKNEKLAEHVISLKDNQETEKYFETEESWDAVDLVIANRNYAFALSDNAAIDTLRIFREGQIYGLSFLKNEGDLNDDGNDEISYVVDWADFSNLNSWQIASYRDHEWKVLYSFPIWDWQLPDLPLATNQYGLFGTEGKVSTVDTSNARLADELAQWKGLVRKIRRNKIRIIYRNHEVEIDSTTVNLKHPKKIKGF